MTDSSEKPTQVYAAGAANLVIAASKFIAAIATGSSAMLSEGIHSVADTGNQLLLLFGVKRSQKPPDEGHAFGHGQEIYFWGFIVAMILFSLGGGMSIYEGIRRLQHGTQLSAPLWNYVVLGIAAIAETISLKFALGKFRQTMSPGERWWQALRRSKDPTVFIVLAEDSAALLGLAVAAIGISLEQVFQSVLPDAIAAMVIGVILGMVAILLAIETKGLLLGESADAAILSEVKKIAVGNPLVLHVEQPLTMHLGPREILLNMSIQFRPEVTADAVITSVDNLENSIRSRFPEIQKIFIEVSSLEPSPFGRGRPKAG